VPKPTLVYSLGSGAPAGASINPSTGVLTWTPSLAVPVGTVPFTVVVTDASTSALVASRTFNVNVLYGGPPPLAPTVVFEKVVLTQKTNKKGKHVGKPVFSGFLLQYSGAMNSSTAGLAGNYHVFSDIVKKVKKKTTTTFKPVPFSVSYSQANNAVTVNVKRTKPFAKGGEIMISGVTSQAGVLLNSSYTVFTITANAKGIIVA
jgi:hypothetical protein